MYVDYKGNAIDVIVPIYDYLKHREDDVLVVMKDPSTTHDTLVVGVGHQVVPADGLQLGDVITEQQSFDFFKSDFNRLNIYQYLNELPMSYPNYNVYLALASFLWAHGDGQYKSSMLRTQLVNDGFDDATLQSYLKSNWDKKQPAAARRNAEDFDLVWRDPWASTLGDSVINELNQIDPQLSAYVQQNPSYFFIAIIVFLIYLFTRKKR